LPPCTGRREEGKEGRREWERRRRVGGSGRGDYLSLLLFAAFLLPPLSKTTPNSTSLLPNAHAKHSNSTR
jgi:hypothetical protein